MKLNFLKSKKKLHTIAFYNIENLFDTYDDKATRDIDMLPNAEKRWNIKRYKNKLQKIGYVISNIGKKEVQRHPAIIGLAEVENEAVLKDLVSSKHLKKHNYSFVHYNSPDERGIDVALLYDQTVFKVDYSKTFTVDIFDEAGDRDYTRDILLVRGLFEGLELHVIVNHWPSRRAGNNETEHKRKAAALYVEIIIKKIKAENPDSKIIIMGDFNDDPSNKSVKQLVNNQGLFNPMETLISINRGTTVHNGQWNLFDQIIISTNFFESKRKSLRYVNADIYDADFLKQAEGKYKGTPYRTYVGKRYKGGYSDHFPVYIILNKK